MAPHGELQLVMLYLWPKLLFINQHHLLSYRNYDAQGNRRVKLDRFVAHHNVIFHAIGILIKALLMVCHKDKKEALLTVDTQ